MNPANQLGSVWRRRRRGSALEYGAVTFVFLACLALVGLDASNLWHQRAGDIAEAKQDTANLSRSFAQHAQDIFRTADASIIGVVHRLQMDGTDRDKLDQLGRIMSARLAMFPALGDWVIIDDAGVCLSDSQPVPKQNCGSLFKENFDYHRVYDGNETYLGAPMRAAPDGPWLIPLSHRFDRPDGSFGGIVVAGISVDYFQRFYATFKIGDHGAILLANRNGMLLVRHPFAERNIGRDLHNSSFFRNYLAKSANGDAEVTSATDGVLRINSYRGIEGYPLVVSVAMSTEEILTPWRAEVRSRVLRTGVLVLIIGSLGLWLTRQIRGRQRLEDAYHEASDAFRVLAENSTDLIIKTDADMTRQYVSPASRTVLGYEPEELVGRRTDEIVLPEDRPIWEEAALKASAGVSDDIQATYRVRRKDGAPIWVEVNRRRLTGNEGFVVVTRDVTQRKQAEEHLAAANRQLERIANLDGLTGLANRRHFDDTLAAEFARAQRDRTVLSLVMIDVDCFKLFNDRYGHPAGDGCLKAIAGALSKLPGRPGDVVARYGGEELVIVLPNTPPAGAALIAERARAAVQALALAHEGNGPKVVTISLGVASLIPDGPIHSGVELVQAADRALYRAKEGGRNRICQAAESETAAPPGPSRPMAANDAGPQRVTEDAHGAAID